MSTILYIQLWLGGFLIHLLHSIVLWVKFNFILVLLILIELFILFLSALVPNHHAPDRSPYFWPSLCWVLWLFPRVPLTCFFISKRHGCLPCGYSSRGDSNRLGAGWLHSLVSFTCAFACWDGLEELGFQFPGFSLELRYCLGKWRHVFFLGNQVVGIFFYLSREGKIEIIHIVDCRLFIRRGLG